MAYLPYSPQIGCKYVLTAPSGRRAVFNDSTDADYVGDLTDISGLDSAEIRESSSDLVQADGGSHGDFYFGRRPITMTTIVYNMATATARESRLDKARRVMHECMRADGILSWQNNPIGATSPAMQTWVRNQQPFRVTGNWVKTAQIALVSQFAPMFSQALHTSASTANGTAVSLENQGDYPSFPLVNITGPGSGTLSNPTVMNGLITFKTTGLTLASGETVQFDMLNHIGTFTAGARNGQSANRYIDWANTAWPSLTGGGNTSWTLAGTSGGTMTVVWRDAWS